MEESILFILLDDENYIYCHYIVKVKDLPISLKELLEKSTNYYKYDSPLLITYTEWKYLDTVGLSYDSLESPHIIKEEVFIKEVY